MMGMRTVATLKHTLTKALKAEGRKVSTGRQPQAKPSQAKPSHRKGLGVRGKAHDGLVASR